MRRGFSLIEVLVVIAVIGLVIPAIFAIVFTLSNQQVKIYRMAVIKKQGDSILSLMSNLIRSNAVSVHSSSPATELNQCNQTSSINPQASIYFLDKDNQWFGFYQSSNTVASSSSVLVDPVNLTSTDTMVYNFSTSCTQASDFSSPVISVSFSICYVDKLTGDCNQTRPEEQNNMYYQTKIKLRN